MVTVHVSGTEAAKAMETDTIHEKIASKPVLVLITLVSNCTQLLLNFDWEYVIFNFITNRLVVIVQLADACYLPKSVGRCGNSQTKFYYNYETRQCEEFVYGGCLGNENKFDTSEECELKCITPQRPGMSQS
jgi:hypothetical protein